MKLLDTCFLIDLQREWARGENGKARRYLAQHAEIEFRISVISIVEFLEGYEQPADGERFLESFPQLTLTEDVARIAGRIRRRLRGRGEMIGDFDILIAATAMAADLPIVTDSTEHFGRVEGLAVEKY